MRLSTEGSSVLGGNLSCLLVILGVSFLLPSETSGSSYFSSTVVSSSPSSSSFSSRTDRQRGISREAYSYYSYYDGFLPRSLQQATTAPNSTTEEDIIVVPPVEEIWKAQNANLTFGLINTGSPVFVPVEQGWNKTCREFNVNCYYVVSNGTCESPRAELLQEFIDMGVNGIAIKPCNDTVMTELFQLATEANIPVVTFDSDVENSTRSAYIGTDNVFLGQTMARLLRQLRPDGGTFAMIGEKEDRSDGFRVEIMKFNNRSNQAQWHEVIPPFNVSTYEDDWMGLMTHFATLNPTAMVLMYQTPMRDPLWEQFVDSNRFRNMTIIGVDAADYQLSYLNRRYVEGLVGQMPYEIGSIALKVLYELATTGKVDKDFYPTNLVTYNLIPIELPPLTVDQHLLGNLKILGFTCFALVALAALTCSVWAMYYRRSVVVKAAQPFFLLMVSSGTIILSSTLIPLSFDTDDVHYDTTSRSYRIGICMSIPWLGFLGFTVIFAALFSKTWRVTKLFRGSGSPFTRGKVGVKDVLAPFAILLSCNIIVLICWTVLDPLTYVRVVNEGTDYWNRVLSTYGACRSENAIDFLAPLAAINFIVVVIASWQAYRARDIESEFSEAKYIGLSVFSMLQAFLTGIPVIAVVKDMPEAFYVVLTMMIFLLSFAVLLLIFYPKMMLHRNYARMSESDQKRQMLQRVRQSAAGSGSFNSGSREWSGQQYQSSQFGSNPFTANSADRRDSSGRRSDPQQSSSDRMEAIREVPTTVEHTTRPPPPMLSGGSTTEPSRTSSQSQSQSHVSTVSQITEPEEKVDVEHDMEQPVEHDV